MHLPTKSADASNLLHELSDASLMSTLASVLTFSHGPVNLIGDFSCQLIRGGTKNKTSTKIRAAETESGSHGKPWQAMASHGKPWQAGEIGEP